MLRPDRMDTVELIKSRRSFRGPFSEQGIEKGTLETILRCGLAAPSSKNARPWHFHVVTSRSRLEQIALAVVASEGAQPYVPVDPRTGAPRADWPSTVKESAAVLAAAAAAVFIENTGEFSHGRAVVADAPRHLLDEILFTYSLELIGIGAAIMNMWTAANALGVRAAFMGDICVAETQISKVLGLAHDLAGVLVLGFGDEGLPPRALESEFETRTTWHS
jgi:nitroreductase